MKLKSIFAFFCVASLVVCTSCGDSPDSETSRLFMPNLIGVDIEQAEVKYDFIQITAIDSDYSNEYDEGIIIDQSVDCGEEIKKGERIEVTLSMGKKIDLFKMADFVGKDYNDTVSKYGNNIRFEVVGSEYNELDENKIIWQSIAPDTEYEKGETLKVKISKGQEEVEVPKLSNLKVELAKEQLALRGLKHEIISTSHPTIEKDYVIESDPKEGTVVKKDTVILLYVSMGADSDEG